MYQLFCAQPNAERGKAHNIAQGLVLAGILNFAVDILLYIFSSTNTKTQSDMLKYSLPVVDTAIFIFFIGISYYHPEQFSNFKNCCKKKESDVDPELPSPLLGATLA